MVADAASVTRASAGIPLCTAYPSERPPLLRHLLLAHTITRLRLSLPPRCSAFHSSLLQLVAIECIRALVDDWNFEEVAFVPVVGPTMGLLVRLVGSSTELDTQTQAFSLMNLVIERMGESILPYVASILALLPQLWTDAEGQSLLRIQVGKGRTTGGSADSERNDALALVMSPVSLRRLHPGPDAAAVDRR